VHLTQFLASVSTLQCCGRAIPDGIRSAAKHRRQFQSIPDDAPVIKTVSPACFFILVGRGYGEPLRKAPARECRLGLRGDEAATAGEARGSPQSGTGCLPHRRGVLPTRSPVRGVSFCFAQLLVLPAEPFGEGIKREGFADDIVRRKRSQARESKAVMAVLSP